MKFIVSIIKFAFVVALKFVQPYSSILTSSSSFIDVRVLLIRFSESKSIFLCEEKNWQCSKKWVVVSMSKLQGHKGLTLSRKLWRNLCSLKWLSPNRCLVRYVNQTGSCKPKFVVGEGRVNLRRACLKPSKVGKLQMVGSKLFHNRIESGKKLWLKKSVLHEKLRIRVWLRVLCPEVFVGRMLTK